MTWLWELLVRLVAHWDGVANADSTRYTTCGCGSMHIGLECEWCVAGFSGCVAEGSEGIDWVAEDVVAGGDCLWLDARNGFRVIRVRFDVELGRSFFVVFDD